MMSMEDYLKEIEFAVIPILSAIWYEHAELENINTEMVNLSKVFWQKHHPIQSSADGEMDIKQVIITGGRPSVFLSREDEMIYSKEDERKILKNRIFARNFAIGALSGTLLQFAKQGISIVHGNPKACSDGRSIGTQNLKSIVWEGRNQSLHWNEGSHGKPLSKSVKECFRRLAFEVSMTRFGCYSIKNLGFEVVGLLEWKTFADFKNDMLTLR